MPREDPPCLTAAIEYLRRGWSPIPLCPADHSCMDKRHCEACEEESWGKTPVRVWKPYQERPANELMLRHWWKETPMANVGIVLGRVSGMIGLDVDGPEAEDILRELSLGDVPPTLGFTTPGGGRRLFYAVGKDEVIPRRKVCRGTSHLLILGEGSYTVMPPSLHHKTGGQYRW